MPQFAPSGDTPYPCAPEDMPPTPRRVGVRPRARLVRGLLLFGSMLGPVAILFWGYTNGQDLRELAAEGQHATGQVTDKSVHHPGRGARTYYVRYAFTAGGRKLTGSQQVEADEYADFAEGGSCPVTYLPGRPEVHCLGNARERLGTKNMSVVYFALAASGLLALGYGVTEFSLRRELRLARVGVPVAGRVCDRGCENDEGHKRHWASYRFATGDGARYTGQNQLPQWVWDYLYPGTPVLILQDPDNPDRHRPMYALRSVYIDISPPAEGGLGDASPGGYEG